MQILEWLRDPVWQFVGAFVAIGSLFFFLFYRRRKKISYQIQITQLLTVKEDVKSKLKISYEGRKVEELNLVKLRITNSGNQPVLANDFESPMAISFSPKAKIFKANVSGTNPAGLKPSISIEGASIKVQPLLLNQKDWITMNILVSYLGEGVNVEARVAGVRELSSIDPSRYIYLMLYGFFAFIGAISFSVIYAVVKQYLPPSVATIASSTLFAFFFLGMATMIVGFVRFGQLFYARLD